MPVEFYVSETIEYVLPEYLAAKRQAQRRHGLKQAVGLAAFVGGFVTAGLLLPTVNQIRRDRQLFIDPEGMKGLPPDIALLGKLGTFRALVIDWASIRADRLKEEGKTYEALQLHEMICNLAPRFPEVWVNAAWNMAYNISVMKYSPEERWQWVCNGIAILRDKGIRYNPQAVGLYKELAWIYWHKIGDFLDDEHLNYKKALAVDMETVLGPPPVVLNDQQYFDWFRKIVDAPRDVATLLETDAEISQLVGRLRDVELYANESLLEFVARNARRELRPEQLVAGDDSREELNSRRRATVTDPRYAGALDRLLAALRSRSLREKHKFNLEYMYDLMVNQYGPLDWRNAFAHSLYWSSYGDRHTRGREGARRADVVNTARFVFFSLQNLILRGKIILWPDFDDPFRSYIELVPDIRFIPYLHDTYLRLGKEHFGDDPRFKEGTPGPNYKTGFVSSMQNWIELLYLEGGEENVRRAEDYYAWLRDNNPHPDGSTQEQYQKTLDEFVMGDILSQLDTYKAVGSFIRRFVQRGLWSLSWGEPSTGIQNFKRARMCYDYWMADTTRDMNDRRKLQRFELIFRDSIDAFLRDSKILPLVKVRLWTVLGVEQRQQVYDRLVPYFEAQCAAQKPVWDVRKAFPEPPGMEEFRQQVMETRGDRREDVEQGEIPK